MTARDLWQDGLQQRAQLQALGIGSDSLVIYAAGNRPELLGVWLACRWVGAALMPVDAGTTFSELGGLAERFGAALAILPAGAGGADATGLLPYLPGLVRAVGPHDSPRQSYREAVVLKLTSGSTGLPKAAITTEHQLIEDTLHITTAMDIRADDCQMAAIPLSHAYGIGNLVVPLFVQGTALVLREGFVPHQFAADAEAYGARVFPGVPFMFEHFTDHYPPGTWPRRLDRLISAGARLDVPAAHAFQASFGVKIHSFYGTSETGGIAFDDSDDNSGEGTVGRPMPGVTITLHPEEGAPTDGGRVHVAGSAVASGYVGGDSTGSFTAGGFLTGDLGRFTDRGYLALTGRASSFINVAGRKVQPEEVEAVLREMAGVADVRVLGAPDPARGEQIVACLVVDGTAPTVLQIRQFCAARLAPHKIPRRTITVDRIPLTERGKTDRRALQDLIEQRLRQAPEAGVV